MHQALVSIHVHVHVQNLKHDNWIMHLFVCKMEMNCNLIDYDIVSLNQFKVYLYIFVVETDFVCAMTFVDVNVAINDLMILKQFYIAFL